MYSLEYSTPLRIIQHGTTCCSCCTPPDTVRLRKRPLRLINPFLKHQSTSEESSGVDMYEVPHSSGATGFVCLVVGGAYMEIFNARTHRIRIPELPRSLKRLTLSLTD